jgi:hypothetical protein
LSDSIHRARSYMKENLLNLSQSMARSPVWKLEGMSPQYLFLSILFYAFLGGSIAKFE